MVLPYNIYYRESDNVKKHLRQAQAIIFFLLIFCINTAGEARASRHAVLVYDADRGRVLHEENGYAQRYPASLTKMMTLYMLFEQMRAGRVTLQTPMKISALAASQPQTNISLRRGEVLTVEQAIKALVVRSANDAAVVVAEHIGGSVPQFAKLATEKARRLGMTGTRFKNPHGLPDNGQVTTAKDMALLGAALRRDFPQYFGYFTTKQFIYKGRRYGSHNRVIGRLQGVDGIKTGYINASGFNLVSSFKHDGFNIVAVVMGGNTAAERDNRMVALLKKTHIQLAEERRGGRAADFQVAFAPTPVFKPVAGSANVMHTAMNTAPTAQAAPQMVASPLNNTAPVENNFSVRVAERKAANNQFSLSLKPAAYQVASAQGSYPVPQRLGGGSVAVDKGWAVQIGIYREADSAKAALSKVARAIRDDLTDAVAYVEAAQSGSNIFHRARLRNLSQQHANAVCQKLQSMKHDCFVTRVN
jgi:D-alanyl-D-alanine carboxypeptidase